MLSLPVINVWDSITSALTFLNDQSGILTLISIVAAIVVFFYQQHNEKVKFNERIVNASKSLKMDLEELEKSYSSDMFAKTTFTEKNICSLDFNTTLSRK